VIPRAPILQEAAPGVSPPRDGRHLDTKLAEVFPIVDVLEIVEGGNKNREQELVLIGGPFLSAISRSEILCEVAVLRKHDHEREDDSGHPDDAFFFDDGFNELNIAEDVPLSDPRILPNSDLDSVRHHSSWMILPLRTTRLGFATPYNSSGISGSFPGLSIGAAVPV